MTTQKSSGPLADYTGLIPSEKERVVLDKQQMETFIRVSMAPKDKLQEVWDAMIDESEDGKGVFAALVLNGRLKSVGLDTSIAPDVKFFCTSLCKSPGMAVMWAYTLCYMAVQLGCTPKVPLSMDVNAWSAPEYFGWGIPTEEYCHAQWDAQKKKKGEDWKSGGDNWIDHSEYWPRVVSEQPQEPKTEAAVV